jgi:hypothetical protein
LPVILLSVGFWKIKLEKRKSKTANIKRVMSSEIQVQKKLVTWYTIALAPVSQRVNLFKVPFSTQRFPVYLAHVKQIVTRKRDSDVSTTKRRTHVPLFNWRARSTSPNLASFWFRMTFLSFSYFLFYRI